MPLYEYKCGDCGRSFENLVTMSAADKPQVCPSCGSSNSQRQLSVFSSGSGNSTSSSPAGCGGCGGGSPYT